MHKLSLLLTISIIFNYLNVYGQFNIKLYSGVHDGPGLAIEYAINKQTGVELRGSFRTKKTSNYYINADVLNRENNIFMNSKIKRYSAKKYANHGIFYGAYLRYWQNFQAVIDTDTWTEEQISYAENENGWISTRTHKISLGLLSGYKGKIAKSLTWEIVLGAGASPPPLYFERNITTQENKKRKVNVNDSMLGALNYLSLLGQISIGYRF